MATSSRNSSLSTRVAIEGEDKVQQSHDVEKGATAAVDEAPSPKPRSKLTFRQYMIVISCFVQFLNTWGLLLSFGTFQTYYQEVLLTNMSSSDIAWISTVCAFISISGGVVTGPFFDRGYLRPLLVIGILLEVFGLMMISVSTEFYQLFLSQGVCCGIGMALLYVPSLSNVCATFDDKTRPKVIGIVASATGLGGVIYPIMFQRLLTSIGFAWTVRTIGFFVLVTDIPSLCMVFFKSDVVPKVRPWVDWTVFTDPNFVLTMLGGFMYALSYLLPLLYIPSFASTGISPPADQSLTFYLISIINGVSAVCRLGAGQLAARLGPVESTTLSLCVSTVLLFCWTAVSSVNGIIAWAVCWGFGSSLVVATIGAVVPVLSPSLDLIGTRSGMFWASVGTGLLLGGPIGGALIDERDTKPKWWHVQITAGLFMLSAALLFIKPVIHVRTRGRPSTARK